MSQILKSVFLVFVLFSALSLQAQLQKSRLSIGESQDLYSAHLNENRRINIYMPDDYDTSGKTKYPVIYILDGGMEEDFVHLVGLVRFNSQPWVGRVPTSIVVGIENTNRRRDFTHAVANTDFIVKEGFKKEHFPQYGGSEKYIDFIEKELQPFIQKNYHANDTNTIIGESLAGLLTTEILLKRPQLFSNYIIISPSLWWGEQELLNNSGKLISKNLKKPVNIYIGAPSKEEDLKMYTEVEGLYNSIKGSNVHTSFDYLPDETHATVVHQAVSNAFKTRYNSAEKEK